mgnify:CR=1 FL=1
MKLELLNYLSEYKKWLKNKNMSNNTIDCYMTRLNDIFKNKHKIDKDYLFLKKAKLEETMSPRTVNLSVNAINSYIDFYIEKFEDNVYSRLKMKCIKITRKNYLENVISYQEYLQFTQWLKENKEYKYYYLVITLGCTGMRISELVKCNVQAVKIGYFDVIGKGGKSRRIYIPKKLQEELLVYIKDNNLKQFLFTNKDGVKITERGVAHQLNELAKRCGINEKVVYPHSFRHMYAKQFISKRQDIALLADLLGHSSIETTRIYLRLTSEEQKQIVDEVVTW